MKIVHIAPNAPYNEGWGYQENLLPKYHQKLGNEVTLIVSVFAHEEGKLVDKGEMDYVNSDGVRIIRRAYKKYPTSTLTNMHAEIEVYPLLQQIRPDYIFFHGLLGTTIYQAVRYKKRDNPSCVIVRDNHMDYHNGARCKSLKDKAIRAFHRYHLRKTMPYVEKVYGVTPWRKQYAEDYFKAPKEKTGMLIMGADDEKIDLENRQKIRAEIRQKYGVKEEEFLVVTGGKIDANKKVRLLMQACKHLKGVKLLIFGSLQGEEERLFQEELASSKNAFYVGWISADSVYDYFFAADLVAFPGTHSVLWEQACASKTPCMFARWEGMDHVDNGGNSRFVDDSTVAAWQEAITSLADGDGYLAMKRAAEEKTDIYLYSHIAKQSLTDIQK